MNMKLSFVAFTVRRVGSKTRLVHPVQAVGLSRCCCIASKARSSQVIPKCPQPLRCNTFVRVLLKFFSFSYDCFLRLCSCMSPDWSYWCALVVVLFVVLCALTTIPRVLQRFLARRTECVGLSMRLGQPMLAAMECSLNVPTNRAGVSRTLLAPASRPVA
jgi:hypothetical protein